jgi:hypothetical protein
VAAQHIRGNANILQRMMVRQLKKISLMQHNMSALFDQYFDARLKTPDQKRRSQYHVVLPSGIKEVHFLELGFVIAPSLLS